MLQQTELKNHTFQDAAVAEIWQVLKKSMAARKDVPYRSSPRGIDSWVDWRLFSI